MRHSQLRAGSPRRSAWLVGVVRREVDELIERDAVLECHGHYANADPAASFVEANCGFECSVDIEYWTPAYIDAAGCCCAQK